MDNPNYVTVEALNELATAIDRVLSSHDPEEHQPLFKGHIKIDGEPVGEGTISLIRPVFYNSLPGIIRPVDFTYYMDGPNGPRLIDPNEPAENADWIKEGF